MVITDLLAAGGSPSPYDFVPAEPGSVAGLSFIYLTCQGSFWILGRSALCFLLSVSLM